MIDRDANIVEQIQEDSYMLTCKQQKPSYSWPDMWLILLHWIFFRYNIKAQSWREDSTERPAIKSYQVTYRIKMQDKKDKIHDF